jgi:hypothetical protein
VGDDLAYWIDRKPLHARHLSAAEPLQGRAL